MDIRINTFGKILQGDDTGWYVKIIDDSEHTGGYLILLSPDLNSKKGFDDWVENEMCLKKYFVESNWVIEWLS